MKKNQGQSLVEVVVGLAIMMIVVLSLVTVTTVAVRNASFSRNQMLATKYAQEGIEEARNLRDTQTETVFFLDGSCDGTETVGVFTRARTCRLTVVEEDRKTMKVEVTVSWSDAQGTHKSELTTELTNWK